MILPRAKTTVPPSGRLDAPYVLIGEQPGRIEVSQRRVFVGPAGNELNSDLNAANVDRPLCYITNVIKDLDYYKDRYIQLYKNKRLLHEPIIHPAGQAYLDFLQWELSQTSAKYFGAIGGIALFALTGRIGINKWRGSVLDCTLIEGRKVIPMLHPATVIGPTFQYLNKRLIIFDLKRLKTYQAGLTAPTEREVSISPTFIQSLAFLNYCQQKGLEGNRISYDIEVFMNRTHKQVSCIAFAVNRHAMCIPFTDSNGDYFLLRQEMEIWKKIAEILEDPKICICGQNLVFDGHFLLRTYGIRVNNLDDTMIAQNTIMPDYPKGLDFITSLWTDHPYYKADGKAFFKGSGKYQKFWIYNATDANICDEAISKQMIEVERLNNMQIYKSQAALIEPLVYMMERGLKVNVKEMERSGRDYEEKINEAQLQLNKLAGEPLNANSFKQLEDYFFHKKKIKQFKDKGKVTYNDNAMKRMIRKGVKEAIFIQQIRRFKKLRSTYLDLQKIDNDGRLRCSYNPVGTRYSRLSSSKNIWGTGCLKPEAEVLTPNGWVMFKNFKEGMTAAQWASNGEISWTVPKLIKYKNDSKYMIRANSDLHRNYYTSFHRIPKITKRGVLSVKYAKDIFMTNNWFLPLSGLFKEGKGCHLSARILAMVQADGSIEDGGIRLTFTKQRKIDRCIKLLINAGFDFTEQSAKEGYRRFYIRSHDAKPYLDFLGPNKLLSKKLLNLTQKQMREFIEEIGYWDAHIRNKSCQYYTAKRPNADWVATIAHLIGYSATINLTENNKHEDSYGSNTLLWIVNIKPRYKACQKSDMYSVEKYDGDVYCLQTLTSFFLCRYQDRICITGNSNHQNWPHALQEFLTPDNDYIYYAFDLSQAENRIVAYVGEVINMIECFETGKDVHAKTARMPMAAYYEGKIPEDVNVLSLSPLGDGQHDWRFWGKKANHCILDDTDVLSKDGWISVSQAAFEYCEIACFSETGDHITFEVPSNWLVEDYSGDIINFEGRYISQRVTPEHRIPYRERGSNINTKLKWETADKKKLISSNEWLLAGTYRNGTINMPNLYIRLMVAFQADGGWDWKAPIWHLKNHTKITRIKTILNLLRVDYTERKSIEKEHEYTIIYIKAHNIERDFLRHAFAKNKEWTYELMDLDEKSLAVFCDEIVRWDGDGKCYWTSIKKNAEIVQTIFHISGFKSSIGWACKETGTYRVSKIYKTETRCDITKRIDEKIKTSRIFCPTVSTGAILIRHKNKISVTGNSLNYDLGYKNFSLVNEMSEINGKMIYLAYHRLYPEIQQCYHGYVKHCLRNGRTLTNLMGRRTSFLGAISGQKADATFKEAYSCIPQGTVGDIINQRGINYIYYNQDLFKLVELLRQVHDEIGFQIPLSASWAEHAEMLTLIKKSLETPLTTHNGRSFVIPAELTMGVHMNKELGIDIDFNSDLEANLKYSWQALTDRSYKCISGK